jgi:energy-coupling factor transport system ATP-binding protein
LTVEREIAFGLQNIGIHSDELRRRVNEQLSFAGLHEVRDRPPRTLSGGEQQRLALAAVLAMRPTYLVLDEATSLLSPESRTRLLHEVDRERTSRGTTVILITQFAEEALLADRLIILHSGRIALDAPPPAVFNSRAELEQWSLPAPSMMRRGHEP